MNKRKRFNADFQLPRPAKEAIGRREKEGSGTELHAVWTRSQAKARGFVSPELKDTSKKPLPPNRIVRHKLSYPPMKKPEGKFFNDEIEENSIPDDVDQETLSMPEKDVEEIESNENDTLQQEEIGVDQAVADTVDTNDLAAGKKSSWEGMDGIRNLENLHVDQEALSINENEEIGSNENDTLQQEEIGVDQTVADTAVDTNDLAISGHDVETDNGESNELSPCLAEDEILDMNSEDENDEELHCLEEPMEELGNATTSESSDNGDNTEVKAPNKLVEAKFRVLPKETQLKILDTKFDQFYAKFDLFRKVNSDGLELYGISGNQHSCVMCTHKGIKINRNKTGDFHIFDTPSSFKRHWKSFHKAPLICEFCGGSYDNKLKLLGHHSCKSTKCFEKYAEKRAKEKALDELQQMQ